MGEHVRPAFFMGTRFFAELVLGTPPECLVLPCAVAVVAVLLGAGSSLLIARFTMRFAVLVCVLLSLVSGCAPSVSPLYRDFAASSVLDAASNGATVPA